MGIAQLVGCMGYSSIGGLYGVWLYWRDVWGIVLLAGFKGYIMCALLAGCMGYSSINNL